MSIREIAHMLGRNPSTIPREIKRGITIDGTFFAASTEWQIRQKKLKDKQSPRQIQNHILEDTGYYLGKDAIYDFIYRYKLKWAKYLKRKHKWRKNEKK